MSPFGRLRAEQHDSLIVPPDLALERDARGAVVHVRNRRSGECLGCIEVGLFEVLRALILSESKTSLTTDLLSQPTRAMYVAAQLKGGQQMARTFNPQVEAVIAESTQPELVRGLIAALEEGQFTEEQQGHALALLQLYDVDLFDPGLAVLSDKTPEEIERLANQRDC